MAIMGDNEQRLWERECDEKTLEVEFNLLVEKLRRKKEIIEKIKEERIMLIQEIKKLHDDIGAIKSRSKKLKFYVCVLILVWLVYVKILPVQKINVLYLA